MARENSVRFRKTIFLRGISLVLCAFLAFGAKNAVAQSHASDPLLLLRQEYRDVIDHWKTRSLLAEGPYSLAYFESRYYDRVHVGRVLEALRLQEERFEKVLQRRRSFAQPLLQTNTVGVESALGWIEWSMSRRCRDCATSAQRREFRKTTRSFMEFYGLVGANRSFSGIPFFKLILDRFNDPVFQNRTLKLHEKLVTLSNGYRSGNPTKSPGNLLQIATEICDGDRAAATELLGLLLSRDSSIVSVIEYFPEVPGPKDLKFLKSMSEVPLLTRLVSELERVRTKSIVDTFSFDGTFGSPNTKNYYYWSSALTTQHLKAKGHSPSHLQTLSMEFPRHYKILRRIQNRLSPAVLLGIPLRFHKDPWGRKAFERDTFEVLRMSASGARNILQGSPSTCGQQLADSVKGLLDPPLTPP